MTANLMVGVLIQNNPESPNQAPARAELNSGCEDRGDLLKHVKVTQWVRGRLKSHPTKG
jgi:hypothetical protein